MILSIKKESTKLRNSLTKGAMVMVGATILFLAVLTVGSSFAETDDQVKNALKPVYRSNQPLQVLHPIYHRNHLIPFLYGLPHHVGTQEEKTPYSNLNSHSTYGFLDFSPFAKIVSKFSKHIINIWKVFLTLIYRQWIFLKTRKQTISNPTASYQSSSTISSAKWCLCPN